MDEGNDYCFHGQLERGHALIYHMRCTCIPEMISQKNVGILVGDLFGCLFSFVVIHFS